ncbi:MAG: aminotransferase class IV [Actinomycetes bacterium]
MDVENSAASQLDDAADEQPIDAQPVDAGGVAFVNGTFVPLTDAKISVVDLGVTRSDSTYDVAHVWKGRFFRLDAHLDRFLANVEALRLSTGYTREQLEEILHECVRRSTLTDAYVSMTCTRGRLPQGSRDLRQAVNTFYCFAVPFVWVQTPEQQLRGARLWISPRPRIPESSVDSSVKNYHWLDLDLAQLAAYDHGAELVVLSDVNGGVSEGPGYNVFARVGDRWVTPRTNVLPGVTRRTVIEIMTETGMGVEEGRLDPDELRAASEVLVTSTAGGVMPVTEVDGQAVGTGEPGPLTREVHRRYWARHSEPRWSTPVSSSPSRPAPRDL